MDGNERLGLAALIACYGVNGRRLMLTNDEACALVMAVAAGQLDHVHDIAARLRETRRAGDRVVPRFTRRR